MQRADMVQWLKSRLGTSKEEASDLLQAIEEMGMEPPRVSGYKAQALMNVYVYPNFNQWEETLNTDVEYLAALKRKLVRVK